MPGLVVSVAKAEGDLVQSGETVLILEAMKMQNTLAAPATGKIVSLPVETGSQVARGDVLCVIEPG
jgi:biotin carboxyl carrier protein